jgi:hypothetical protein
MATVDSDGRDRAHGPRMPSRNPNEPMSMGKASLIGACSGLGIVALFVMGFRMAYRPPSASPAVANAQATQATPMGTSTSHPAESVARARLHADESPDASTPPPNGQAVAAPGIMDAALPDAALPSAVAARGAPGPPPPAWHKAGPAPARHGAPAAKTASASGPGPEDETSQTSLVPVIPDSPPPAVDPLVKAVQDLEPSAPPHSP